MNNSQIIQPNQQQSSTPQDVAPEIIKAIEKAYNEGAKVLVLMLQNMESSGFTIRANPSIPANRVLVEIGLVSQRNITKGGFEHKQFQAIHIGGNYTELMKNFTESQDDTNEEIHPMNNGEMP